jgi:kinesin family protein 4/21/27
MSANASAVRVAVRVRPLLALEHGNKECLSVLGKSKQIRVGDGNKHSFTFDYTLDQQITQEQIYATSVSPMLQGVADGYNVTLLAYGQTGSGKTYTMGTATDSLSDATGISQGIMPRAVSDLFDKLEEKRQSSGAEINVTCTLLEIYNESLHDLMVSNHMSGFDNHSKGRTSLGIREQKDGSVSVPGLREIPVSTVEDVLVCIRDGSMNRATSSTNMNATSSRSHMIVTINIEHSSTGEESGGVTTSMTSRLTLVDLAGSERLKRTGATGARAKEGISINKGLLALGNVINALADDQRTVRAAHIPYRDSKLTRLLQDALGGNSRTLFIACVSPSESNFEETLNTLRYANRARNIRNKAVLNCSPEQKLMMLMNAQMNALESELVRYKFKNGESGSMDETLAQEDVKKYLATIKENAVPEGFGNAASLPNLPRFSVARKGFPATVASLPPAPQSAVVPMLPVPNLPNPAKRMAINFNAAETNDEMAFLDEEIELAKAVMLHDEVTEKVGLEIEQMDSKLKSKEAMLLKIKETISDYQELQQRYVWLQNEVNQAEGEKQHLLLQLQAAEKERDDANSKDTSTAASAKVSTMKKRLDTMNSRIHALKDQQRANKDALSRAKSEKARADRLEKSIAELKIAKTKAIKQQSAREKVHRDWQRKKNAEINALKNKIQREQRNANKSQRTQQQQKVQLQRRNKVVYRLQGELKKTKKRLLNMVKQNTKQRRFRARRRHIRHTGGEGLSANQRPRDPQQAPRPTVDADLEAREHLIAMHVEAHVRKVELEESLQHELQRRGELLQELAILIKDEKSVENENEEDDAEETVSLERAALQSHIDTLQNRIDEIEAELIVVSAKCDINDGSSSDPSGINNATTAFDGITVRQAQHMLKKVIGENIEVKQNERVRLASLDKSKAILQEETEKRRAAESARDRCIVEMRQRTAAYERKFKELKQQIMRNGSSRTSVPIIPTMEEINKAKGKRTRGEYSEDDGLEVAKREEKRMKCREHGEGVNQASMDSLTFETGTLDQENTMAKLNQNSLKCHPKATTKERERFLKANIKLQEEKVAKQKLLEEEALKEEMKRKGMTRHMLTTSRRQRRHTDSPEQHSDARDRSSSVPNALPDMVF